MWDLSKKWNRGVFGSYRKGDAPALLCSQGAWPRLAVPCSLFSRPGTKIIPLPLLPPPFCLLNRGDVQVKTVSSVLEVKAHGTTGRRVASRPSTIECKNWVGEKSTLLTASPSSSGISSSDLDTESTGSFFHDKSITLGSLIGISSFLELSRRSTRRRTTETSRDQKNSYKSRPWLFSLCSKLSTDAVDTNKAQSLGHFLEVERSAANIYRRNQTPAAYAPGDFSTIAPRSNGALSAEDGRKSDRELLEHGNGYGAPLLLSCLCGQLIK
ncbi:hypothetical protein CRYUN_Cryun16bG0126900 [Craigia yunnanensis]